MEEFSFNPNTKELKTSGEVKPCAPGGAGRTIFEKMKFYSEQNFIAQIESETGTKDSFKNYLTRCKKLAIYLQQKLGIKPGDIICGCSPNSLNSATPFLSSLFIGAICAYTDPMLSLEDTAYLLKLTEPKVIFVSGDCIDLIQKARINANISCELITLECLEDSTIYENLPNVLKEYPDNSILVQGFEPILIEDTNSTASMFFSSGTTGLPKATCLSHNYISSNIFSTNFEHIFGDGDHFQRNQDLALGFTTLYWVSGLILNLSCCFYGMKRLTCRRFEAGRIWDIVEKFQVNKIILSYYHSTEALETLKRPQLSVNSLMIAGGQITPKKQDEYAAMLPNGIIVNAYGMTEIGCVSLNTDYKNRSSGKPIHKAQIMKIVDPDTDQPLPLTKVGEIRVKHKYQMNGYYKKDSTDCWDAQGFFKTGDIGYLTLDYDLFIVDRIKEMFKYRSWHVIPAKIERHLLKHPSVQHCVVIGYPVPTDDNHAMAIVVLKDNQDNHNNNSFPAVSAQELLKYANDEMDDIHQIRAGLKIVPKNAIPYTITGKINRRLLKNHILTSKINY